MTGIKCQWGAGLNKYCITVGAKHMIYAYMWIQHKQKDIDSIEPSYLH